jgi:hypothetical protein
VFHRAYPIRLRPGVSPEQIAGLDGVLRAATEFIPGFLESELCAAPPGSGHDLVWRNAFADEDAFWVYAGHPYHANLINDYLAPDAPDAVKATSSVGITWTDGSPVGAASASAPAAPVDGAQRVDEALAEVGIATPVVHQLEQIELVAGATAAYLAAVREIYLPAVERHGMRLLMSWQSPPATGEEEVVLLWSMAGWGGVFRSLSALTREADAMERWLETVRPLRTGGRRRYLVPTDLTGDGLQPPVS